MNSSKVKTQKNLSAIIAIALAAITLFQAGAVSATDSNDNPRSKEEAAVLADLSNNDSILFEDDDLSMLEEVYAEFDEATSVEHVKVFNADNELIAEGKPSEDENLRELVNKADFLSKVSNQKYYRLTE